MLEQVKRTIHEYQMLQAGEPVLVALSGGADSTALLCVLLQLGYSVRAFHLNHCLRGAESDRDEAFCRALCEKFSVPLIVERINAAEYAVQIGESVETAARQLRYTQLSAAADGAKIATAHTADDNIETILFHFARGTGPKGLAGIPPVRGNIIRPMIETERCSIEAWLAEAGQEFVTDSTNLQRDYTRNQIRLEVVPLLRQVNPALAGSAVRLSRLLRQDEAYLSQQAQQLLEQASCGMESWEVQMLARAPGALRSRALRMLAEQAGVPMRDFSALHVAGLEKLLQTGNPSASAALPHGFTARREYDILRIIHNQVFQEYPPIPVTIPYDGLLWDGRTRLRIRHPEKSKDIYKTFNTFYADCGTIHVDTLCVRTRCQGDRIRLTETGGSRTLKKRMIDQKIPRFRRDRLAVLADRYGLVAVQDIGMDISRTPQGGTVIEIKFEG